MRHLVSLLVGAAAGAAAVAFLRPRGRAPVAPLEAPAPAAPVGSGHVAVDVTGAPPEPA